jgi:UPF0176 protein
LSRFFPLKYTALSLESEMNYWVLAYYCLTEIEAPKEEVARHQEFFRSRDLKGRIYLSEQGINGQMSGAETDAQEYVSWLRQDPRFSKISFKTHPASEHAFPKATIKYRRQLVALDCEVNLQRTGERVAPKQWTQMLDQRDEDTLILDVRNDYEWRLGHFEGAQLPPLEAFRQFPTYAKKLTKERDPKKTKVMMYCTGGIRCEFYSALMKQEGFEQVYQLEGGIIQYGLEEGQAKWKGKLFVFDDRVVIPISEEPSPPISVCCYCNAKVDLCYNCANMDCNALFISCTECVQTHRGCCSAPCTSGRVRPISKEASPRPFRKWDFEEKRAWQRQEASGGTFCLPEEARFASSTSGS